MNDLKRKFTSRKFIACIVGVLTGVGVIVSGNTVEGIITVITSIISYLITEGIIDAKAVNQVAEGVADMTEATEETTEQRIGYNG